MSPGAKKVVRLLAIAVGAGLVAVAEGGGFGPDLSGLISAVGKALSSGLGL